MKPATAGTQSVHIEAPPQQVYELVADVTRMGEWSPETVECRWLDGTQRPVVGARFKGYNRRGKARWSNTLEVLAAEPGREFAFRRELLPCGICDWRYGMELEGQGTRLTESYEMVKPEWAITTWLNGKLLGIADRDADLQEGMRATLGRIKEAAEREHATASPRPTGR